MSVTDIVADGPCGDEHQAERAKLERMIREVRRELSARKRVYPRLMRDGLLPREVADERNADMRDVLANLLGQLQAELEL